ncbi:MAG TPA: hypothetical protein VN088_05105 [Nocardioides sp.]|nr:hypothetical protein [Nocardioides sp.]
MDLPYTTRRLVAVALLLSNATACGTGTDAPAKGSDDPVCGLVSRALVRRLVGDDAIDTRGGGITSRAERVRQPSTCDVIDADLTRTMLSISVGEVTDPSRWRRTLATEEKDATDICRSYTGNPGDGYGCTYDSGTLVDGAGVNVLRGDRLIRITIMQWVRATPPQRLALAEEIARNVDANVTAYDAGDG